MLSAYERNKPQAVFFSYPQEYSEIVAFMTSLFRQVQMLYYDFQSTPNPPGTKIKEQIFKNIEESTFFILFWGEASVSSDWVKTELNYAIKKNKIIIPIILDEDSIEELPLDVKEYMRLNAYEEFYEDDEDDEYSYIEEIKLYEYAHLIIVSIKESNIVTLSKQKQELENKLKELELSQKPKIIKQNNILKLLNPFNK